MAAIFKSSLQNLSPLPPRLKVNSTDQSLTFKSKSGLKSLCEIGPWNIRDASMS